MIGGPPDNDVPTPDQDREQPSEKLPSPESRGDRVTWLGSWRQARTGDRFVEMMSPRMEGLFRLAFRMTRDVTKAEDLLQTVLIKIYEQRGQLDQVMNVRAWCAQLLRNVFLDDWRRQQLGPISEGELGPADAEAIASVMDPGSLPDAQAQRLQLQDHIQKALLELGPEHRELLIFHDMEGYTMQELETVLGVPIGTIKSRLHRARANLRERLAHWGGTI
jgi:RNA polymerase sigma-70 factor (ECF subfamily)